MKTYLIPFILSLLCSCSSHIIVEEQDYTKYVNTFIGTQGEGHCFPGAIVPMGMVQLSPESYTDYYYRYENARVAGYQYNDPYLIGFTHTHLNGTGCPSLADILFMPLGGDSISGIERSDFKSSYDKTTEQASPGFYHVYLKDHKVDVSLTATPHVGIHKYFFDTPETARLLIDLQYGVKWDINAISDNVLEASQEFIDEYTLTGYRRAEQWTDRKLFYVIKFNHPVVSKIELEAPGKKNEKAPRYMLKFDMQGSNELIVKVGLSVTSIEGAMNNMEQELKGMETFDEVKEMARKKWNDILSVVDVNVEKEKKVSFYTSLYHMYVQPNNLADVDGAYRAENDSIYMARSGKYHSTFSLWDTYRAAHPLYTILTPNLVSEMTSSLLEAYYHKEVDKNNPNEANPYLPRWGLWGKEVHTMIGNHAVNVLVDARLKDIKPVGYSDSEMYEAIKTTLTKPHYRNHVDVIAKYGYIPLDVSLSVIDDNRETVSRLLEGTLNDYAMAQYAKLLGNKEDTEFFGKRSKIYENVYDKSIGFMCGRYASGKFRKIDDYSLAVGEWVPFSDYTEGNPWHYLFHVQQDISGLMELMGGEKVFREKLDSMFYADTHPYFSATDSATGCLGEYWHGNEPCHHVPYLYKYTSEGYKTDVIIKLITDKFYRNAPDGLQGNDDCGQMSAWYVFSMLGFYPVNPCGGEYILGAPQIESAEIKLENEKLLSIKVENYSDKNFIVDKVYWNGTLYEKNYILHSDIIEGGELRFVMKPCEKQENIINFKIN